MTLAEIEARLRALREHPGSAGELLDLGERAVAHWLIAQGAVPTAGHHEGFRLLALQRQGARLDPSFNACRETCRELVYHHNLMTLRPDDPQAPLWARLGAMVALHLTLFVAGKLEVSGLGEFCCAAKPLRGHENT